MANKYPVCTSGWQSDLTRTDCSRKHGSDLGPDIVQFPPMIELQHGDICGSNPAPALCCRCFSRSQTPRNADIVCTSIASPCNMYHRGPILTSTTSWPSLLLVDHRLAQRFGTGTRIACQSPSWPDRTRSMLTRAIRKSLKTPRLFPPNIHRLLTCVSLV